MGSHGFPLINSSTVGVNESIEVAIIDSTDVYATTAVVDTFWSINMITGTTVGMHKIVPGAFLSPNFDIRYALGNLQILPVPLVLTANSASTTYGTAVPSLSSTITGYQYADNIDSVFSGPVTYGLVSTGVTFPAAGNYSILPAAPVIVPSNYTIQFRTGLLQVNKAELTASVQNASRLYGIANPAFGISYSGFKYQDGPTAVQTAPTAVTSANVLSAAGIYPVSLTGGSALNYSFLFANGTLTVTKRPLIVTAEDKLIFRGDQLPAFTAAYTGFANNDQTRILAGPVYTLSPLYTGIAGTHVIIPSGLALQATITDNYQVSYVNGTLYVNPKGAGARNVKPRLECVDIVSNHPSGYGFVARFSYENPNSTIVYVPIGINNSITATGGYSGVQPQVFLPSGGQFDIYFNGTALKWTLVTFNGNQKTSTSSNASSTSNKCLSNNAISRATIKGEAEIKAGIKEVAAQEKMNSPVIGYPNPVTSVLTIKSRERLSMGNNFVVLDMLGKIYPFISAKRIGPNMMDINVTSLKSGMYLINIKTEEGYRKVKFIKQ